MKKQYSSSLRRRNGQALVLLLLVVVVEGLGNLCLGGVTLVQAQGTLTQAFTRAAHDYQVPEPLLKGLCYMEGRLSNHAGNASMDRGYGCMHLQMNDHSSTLAQAAHILGVSPALLRSSMVWNIRGGAAILSTAERQTLRRPAAVLTLDDWYPVIAAYSDASAPNVARMYADALFTLLRRGFRAPAENGEMIVVEPQVVQHTVAALPTLTSATATVPALQHIGAHARGAQRDVQQAIPAHLIRALQDPLVVRQRTLPAGCVDDHNTDYPVAVDCMVNPRTFDCNAVKDTVPCTYESARRPDNALPIEFLVIHDIEGSAQAALRSFRDPQSAASAHYVVDSDGTVYQVVRENDIAYHAGNYWYNQRSIGIEHAGYDATGYKWYNATLYLASAYLTAYLLNKYRIPLDHDHILSHGTIPAPKLTLGPNHVDPGPYWLWDNYFKLINELGISFAPVSDNSTVLMLRPATSLVPLAGGRETELNYNYFPLYNGPSTDSGLIPQVSSGDRFDETGNIEPGVSYVVTNAVLDPAGSGKTLYALWYGVETHPKGHVGSTLAHARQVWLAASPDMLTRGHGMAIQLQHSTAIYGRPNLDASYRIGDAPAGAIFAAPFVIQSDQRIWYVINYNHRQAWIPIDALW
jgi:Negative regulator of beta-lactamase expression